MLFHHACLVTLFLSLAISQAAPAQKADEESLSDILGRLHDVLGSLQRYLEKQVETTTAVNPNVVQRNEEGPIPEISEVDELVDISHRSSDQASHVRNQENVESAESDEVSLRQVLRYLIDMQREHEAHKSHQQRDHGV